MGSNRVAKEALLESLARVGKALGSGTRLEVLDLLAQGERSVEALAEAAGLGVTTCSSHLQVLRRAGLVRARRDGVRVFYALAGDDVAALLAALRAVALTHHAETARARAAYLGEESGEPVPRDELLARLESGDVTLLDVRPAEEWAAGHLPGARSIPLAELPARLDELPLDQEVVAYCRGAYCVLAHDAVRVLTAAGRPARRLEDGVLEWRLAGLPQEGAA